ncbi:MAG: hypothetical protein A2015_00885 [Spirochaetes bacterium GWF1_31_7]|nr:MAG: hypothetical protein A2Y30_12750 [Spirochaetes bacterium GWE1_32_154]OHD51675.1 MAG: hypothetical protein A2Y29_04550 [Spirochaetes bacterium GWE2_31_10]OHD51928.1 MAG: hypothetical protein A2015_00885 [Spirochaetes bacterium GWF1_31_7]OHD75757.1 MAG: hypothetical protein A2355_10760 [Spirochaetes bacterium RIFOXYB1_FULL_32_8]HBD93808.1 flagellar biosynthesis protein FlgM [Spirochaetia bacterium]
MGIDKIGSVNGMNDYSKVSSVSKVKKNEALDSVSISSKAEELNENKRIMDMINEVPDVRADRVKELKAKINDPAYINDKLISGLADKLLNPFND